MSVRLAIITTNFLRDFVGKIICDFFREEDFILYSYHTFRDLRSIYKSIPDNVPGVVVSGSFPAQVIRLCFPDTTRLIKEFNNDDLGVYKLFFGLLNAHRDLRLDRIYADVFDAAGVGLEEYLFSRFERPISEVHAQAAQKLSLEDLTKIEGIIARRHIDKWKNGEIDISITRFSSIMDSLAQTGIPVYFAYPDPNYVRSIILSALQDLTIRDLLDNMPGCLLVTLKTGKDAGTEPASKSAHTPLGRLGHALNAFCALYNFDAIAKETSKGFEVITHRKFIAFATSNFRACALQDYLTENFAFPVCVGYGLGSSLHQARLNAVDANSEASRFSCSASCLINEQGQLISPLSRRAGEGGAPVVLSGVSESVRQLAKTTGLSSLNIQKLSSIVESAPDKRVTSQDISYWLRITRRSANRILTALKKSGRAKVVDQKQTVSLGRPEYVYEIDLSCASD